MKNRCLTFAMGMLAGAVLFGGGAAYAAGIIAEYAPQTAYVDGVAVQMEAYNIGGYNYTPALLRFSRFRQQNRSV